MVCCLTALWADDSGFIITAELVLVGTIVVLGLLSALIAVRDAVGGELSDVACAIRSLDQSYYYGGLSARKNFCGFKSWTAGSSYGAQLRGPGIIQSQEFREPDLVCPPEKIVKPAPLPTPCLTGDCLPQTVVPAPTPVVPCPPGAPCAPAVPCDGCTPGNGAPLPAPQPLVW